MEKKQRSGKELYDEWYKLDNNGVLGAGINFGMSLTPEERKRLFEYDIQREKESEKAKTD